MRRKRRSRGTWFPMLASNRIVGEDVYAYSLIRPTIAIPLNGSPIIGVVPVTFDDPQEPPNANPDTEGLAEFLGNEYIFKRALGSCFVSRDVQRLEMGTTPIDSAGVIVTAGFFVARAQSDNTLPAQSNVPIGWDNQTSQTLFDDYSPQAQASIRKPWMWRRSWILGWNESRQYDQTGEGDRETSIYSSYPRNNVMYPSGPSGPSVDIKSRRRIQQDERLWFAYGGLWLAERVLEDESLPVNVRFDLDIRIFGTLVKAKARGAF